MSKYIIPIPTDKQGSSLQEFPAPFVSKARTYTDSAAVSSVININPNTSSLEIGASGGSGVVVRWVPLTETAGVGSAGSVTSANFDHFVPSGQVRRFAVPVETQGLGTAPMQVGSAFGLYQRIARISVGAPSSVLVSEF